MRTLEDAIADLVAPDRFDRNPVLARVLGPELRDVARRGRILEIKKQITQSLSALEESQDALKALSTELARAESDAPVSGQPDDEWWTWKRQTLLETYQDDPVKGWRSWIRCYASVLAAWRISLLHQIAEVDFPPPATDRVNGATLSALASNLQMWRLGEVVKGIDELLQVSDPVDGPQTLMAAVRSRLLIAAGRIHLRSGDNRQAARAYFEEASRLAPQSGLPLCALAEYIQEPGAPDVHDALGGETPSRLCERAVAAGERVGGNVGAGLLLEREGKWDDADDAYGAAVRALGPLGRFDDFRESLEQLLAPVSGNLYMELGRLASRSGQFATALGALDRALALGVKHDGECPERLAYRLKGEVLEKLGQKATAAAAFAEAASGFQQRGEYSVATDLYRKANELAPDDPAMNFGLARALGLSAVTRSTSDEKKEEELTDALSACDKGLSRQPIGRHHGWWYGLRAWLSRVMAPVQPEDAVRLRWEGVCFSETRIVLDADVPNAWADLSDSYLAVDLRQCASQSAETALRLNATDSDALRQTIVASIGLGRYREALERISLRREIVEDSWNDFVEGYSRAHLGEFENALACLGRGLESENTPGLWVHQAAYICHLNLGQHDLARQDIESIYGRVESADADNDVVFGWAAWRLGRYEEAKTLLYRGLPNPSEETEASWNLGACYLAEGDAARAEEFLRRSVNASTKSDLTQLLNEDLSELENRFAHPLLRSLRRDAEARLGELGPDRTAEEELLAAHAASAASRDARWVGAQAGLARLYRDAKRWPDALAAYRDLAGQSNFPEADRALKQLVQAMEGARTNADDNDQSQLPDDTDA